MGYVIPLYIIRVYSLLPNLASAFSCSGLWVGGKRSERCPAGVVVALW
jgi:hypothetical protein